MWRVLPIGALLALAACQIAPSHPQLIAIPAPAMGGEALFYGTLAIRNGCVVALREQRAATVLFDPGVRLTADWTSIIDPHAAEDVRLDVSIIGGAAFMRNEDKGWPIADIESFFGVIIPDGCPTKNIMRLHHMEEQ